MLTTLRYTVSVCVCVCRGLWVDDQGLLCLLSSDPIYTATSFTAAWGETGSYKQAARLQLWLVVCVCVCACVCVCVFVCVC